MRRAINTHVDYTLQPTGIGETVRIVVREANGRRIYQRAYASRAHAERAIQEATRPESQAATWVSWVLFALVAGLVAEYGPMWLVLLIVAWVAGWLR